MYNIFENSNNKYVIKVLTRTWKGHFYVTDVIFVLMRFYVLSFHLHFLPLNIIKHYFWKGLRAGKTRHSCTPDHVIIKLWCSIHDWEIYIYVCCLLYPCINKASLEPSSCPFQCAGQYSWWGDQTGAAKHIPRLIKVCWIFILLFNYWFDFSFLCCWHSYFQNFVLFDLMALSCCFSFFASASSWHWNNISSFLLHFIKFVFAHFRFAKPASVCGIAS